MFGFKIFYILVLCVIAVCKSDTKKDADFNESYCEGTGWVSYKDEKCFKLVKKPLTRKEAKDFCKQEESQIVSIKSSSEQEYLNEFVFDNSSVIVNVWIGAKRLNENGFAWDDGTWVDFTNWVDGNPSEDKRKNCAVMQSELSRKSSTEQINGKWKDVTCEQWNFVVCEKLQKWSIVKLQQALLDTRKNLRDSQDQVTIELNVTRKLLAVTQNDLSETKIRLSSAENQIDDSKRNSVPIGFIYVQLPNERPPTEIWPLMQWTDVSATYAGVFFRVNGGGAAAFEQIQQDNAPRIETIIAGTDKSIVTKYTGYDRNVSIPRSGWSEGFYNGRDAPGSVTGMFMSFKHSAGEVRPRNMAIRIWKRTS